MYEQTLKGIRKIFARLVKKQDVHKCVCSYTRDDLPYVCRVGHDNMLNCLLGSWRWFKAGVKEASQAKIYPSTYHRVNK